MGFWRWLLSLAKQADDEDSWYVEVEEIEDEEE